MRVPVDSARVRTLSIAREIEHTPEAVEAWAIELSRRFSQRPIAVALEQVRGALCLC